MNLWLAILLLKINLMYGLHQPQIGHLGRQILFATSKKSFSEKSKFGKYTRTVTVRASDIAAIINRNQFKKPSIVFDDMWLKYSPKTFVGQTRDQVAAAATAKLEPAERSMIAAAVTYVAKDAADAVNQFSKAEKKIEASTTLSTVDKALVIDELKSQIFTSHGTRAESKTADLVEEKEGVVLKTDDNFYNLQLCVIDDTMYRISGKVDRLEKIGDEVILVEIKNRMKKLFLNPPDYEYIQVQTYFQIVPLNIQSAKLIQQYGTTTKTTMIERDDNVWEQEILPPLLKFCADLHKAMFQTSPP